MKNIKISFLNTNKEPARLREIKFSLDESIVKEISKEKGLSDDQKARQLFAKYDLLPKKGDVTNLKHESFVNRLYLEEAQEEGFPLILEIT